MASDWYVMDTQFVSFGLMVDLIDQLKKVLNNFLFLWSLSLEMPVMEEINNVEKFPM